MDTLKNLGLKGQIIVAILGACAIGFVGWKVFPPPGLEKQKKEIASKEKELGELQAEIEKGINLEKKLPELKKEIEFLTAQLEQLKAIMPPNQIDSEIVRKFEELAVRSRLGINRMNPGRRQKRDFYDVYPITVDVNANYHDLGLFFSRLADYQRIFNVTSVKMQSKPTESTTIAANFRTETFIYREDAPLVKPKAPAKKGKGKGRRK